MPATDNSQILFGRQVSPDDGGDLRTAANAVRLTGASVNVSEAGGTITVTGLSSGSVGAGQVIHLTGFSDASQIDGIYEVEAARTGSADLLLRTPAGKDGLSATGASGIEAGTLIPFRRSSDSFTPNLNKSPSDEIVPTRGTADLVRLGETASGNVNSGFVLQNLGHMLQSAFCNDWEYNGGDVRTGTGSNVSFNANGTVSETGIQDDFSVGDCFAVRDSGGLNDGKIVVVTALGSDQITVIGDNLITEAGANPEFILADQITPGFKLHPYTVERRYNDITGLDQHFPRFLGMAPSTVSISGASNSPLSFSASFFGAEEVSPTPTSSLGIAAQRPEGSELSTVNDAQAWIDQGNGGCVQNVSVSINNNLNPQSCWGSSGATAIDVRALDISGSFTRYYRTRTLYDKYLADVESSLVLTFKSPEGPKYVLHLPRVEFSQGDRSGGGRNSDLFLNLGFTALIDESLEYTASLWRVEA